MDLQQILDIIEEEYITEMDVLENTLEFSLDEYSEREVVVSKLNEQKEKLNFNYFSKKIPSEDGNNWLSKRGLKVEPSP